VRVEGAASIPLAGAYIICFNHPSWLDPSFLAAEWPDRERRLFIFGPREQDMQRGLRNRLIRWTGRAVPFKPGAQDVVDVTRRATAVLRSGACLAVAGEGRLSDLEGQALPLESGLAHFARLSGAAILPTAMIGTRWVHLGSRVVIRIGRPLWPDDFPAGKAGLAELTAAAQAQLEGLLAGVPERDPPGPLGRWISELFNDRPWLDGPDHPDDPPGRP
jgi:1-acyl-sn-glycerol-3-phosphate acyltransferase